MKAESVALSTPSWDQVVLVCKECRSRSNGPKKLKGKDVVAEARRALRDRKPRPRVLLTSCLGLCPKRAMAVAVVGGTGRASIVAVSSLAEVELLAASLVGRTAST